MKMIVLIYQWVYLALKIPIPIPILLNLKNIVRKLPIIVQQQQSHLPTTQELRQNLDQCPLLPLELPIIVNQLHRFRSHASEKRIVEATDIVQVTTMMIIVVVATGILAAITGEVAVVTEVVAIIVAVVTEVMIVVEVAADVIK